MKKVILLIHRGYPLGGNAGDKVRTLNMAVSLNNLGYDVILLAFYTKGFSLLKEEKRRIPEGIRALFIYSLPNKLGLAKIAALLRAIFTYFICKRYSVDFIQAELSSSATATRFVPRIPLITDFHSDVVPELEMDHYPRSIIRHSIWENKYALTHSDKIITVSENLSRNLNEYGVLPLSYILPCNFNPDPFLNIDPNIRYQLREKYGLAEKIILCYSGGLHTWQCIRETLELVIRLRKLNEAYYLCLFTNDNVEPYADLLGQMDNSYMVKGLQREEMPKYLSMIDVGFVLRVNSLVNINASPTKASEYLASGAMVVATRYAGDVPQQISESGCGIVLDELLVDDECLEKINTQIVEYSQQYNEFAPRAKSYVYQNRAWVSNEEKLSQLYNELPV
jgi:glycosyltransferase involved in cell wall biosynthesis